MKIELQTDNGAKLPTRGSDYAAGYDLYYSGDTVNLSAGERKLLSTGLTMAIPEGYYGRIAPRSGLAYKDGIDVMAGVIDCDYRGEIKVLLVNLGLGIKTFSHGDKIAQIIFEKYHDAEFVLGMTDSTSRGAGGFGSTGK